MKTCQIFFRGEEALVFTQCVTKSGVGIATEPMLRVPSKSYLELGEAVLKCLDASRADVPDPPDYSLVAKEMLRFAGEKSWKRFASNSVLRGVWLLDSRVKIVPYQSAERGSFEQREELSREVPAKPPEELGRSLVDSLVWR